MGKVNLHILPGKDYELCKNFEIVYGFDKTSFGECLVGTHKEHICFLAFCDEQKRQEALKGLQNDWPNAKLEQNDNKISPIIKGIFEENQNEPETVNVLLRGTEFQLKVWTELTKLKEGMTASYSEIAAAVGKPKAIRAVASAIARNRVSYLVPCHRIIRKGGIAHKYRWGAKKKLMMLKHEAQITK